jgi:hypothetical protein
MLNGFGKPVVTYCDDENGLLFSRTKFDFLRFILQYVA